jgi:hypothetical protein
MSLKRKRRMCGLTQHQVARLTNIPLSRICYAESGPHPGGEGSSWEAESVPWRPHSESARVPISFQARLANGPHMPVTQSEKKARRYARSVRSGVLTSFQSLPCLLIPNWTLYSAVPFPELRFPATF